MSARNLRILSFALVGLLVLGVSARDAVALDFSFSFSDDAADDSLGNTHVPGTVTGRILGLSNNTSGQAAGSVLIDSHPVWNVGFGNFDATGIDLLGGSIFANTFDVAGGVITDAYFISNFNPNNGGTAQLRLNSQDGQEPGANVLRHQNFTGSQDSATGNRDGMAGFFSQVVPEPTTSPSPH